MKRHPGLRMIFLTVGPLTARFVAIAEERRLPAPEVFALPPAKQDEPGRTTTTATRSGKKESWTGRLRNGAQQSISGRTNQKCNPFSARRSKPNVNPRQELRVQAEPAMKSCSLFFDNPYSRGWTRTK